MDGRYRSLVLATTQVVWTTDAAGQVVEDLPSWRALTGQTAEELLGTGWLDAIHPDDRDRATQAWRRAVDSRQLYELEYRLRRADGSYRVCIARGVPVLNGDGSLREWVGTVNDLTDRRAAEEQLRLESRVNETLHRLGTAFNRELDSERLVQLVADEATALTGATVGAYCVSGVDTPLAVTGGPRQAFAGLQQETPLFGVTFRGAAIVRIDDLRTDARAAGFQPAPDAPLVSYLAVPIVARSGEVLGGLFLGHPAPGWFVEQHERMIVGVASQAAIALENARLYEQLRQSEEKAHKADRRKDEFLAMLGHELRNPLAPIVTALQVLKLRREGALEEELKVIERQVQHLVSLVDDLLDISRITRGKLELKNEPLELSTVAARAIEMASPLFEQRSHRLTVDVPRHGLPVEGDLVRLSQVVANLLTNAAKYTDPQGHIQLSAAHEGDEVVLTVADNGMGIAPDMLASIFDLFVQGGRALDRAEGGLGIGLTLVKTLTNLHRGRATAHSDGPGRGSRFAIHLPALPMGTLEVGGRIPANGPRKRAMVRRLRVLLVDDNLDAAEMLGEILREVGHDVAVASDGPEALRVLDGFPAEVAVLDIGLPVMDGYELARKIAGRSGPLPRLIALTGYGQDQDRARSETAGFERHFVKPVDVDELLAAISDPRRATPTRRS